MSGKIEARLAELGITLPVPAVPVANYVPYAVTGNLVYTSGQVPVADGAVAWKGKLGAERSIEDGVASARLCALNCIAQLKAACGGDLDRVKRIVKVVIFVSSAAGFNDQPKVGNGASDVLVEIFGDAGKHARSAVGVNELPLDVTTEVEIVAEIA
ncbi:hypothetical protein GCM10011505_08440 [Tistrella bauzanensis]|uniref:Endoribonuclease L-PSP/chorismate mutase-like domain-containing protein n=1 Tax=Tistrella bauzanensis TaxID=657419 RepID=A0ABQ1I982_9PROT|nr:RidA family protein [Tistrella bauzanensis]GGB29410.1 hypothetical protein GCM10011505_08440 [Tistrella bauzanensis]